MAQLWYVAKSKPHQERLLTANLRSFGAEVYYPWIVYLGSGGKAKEPLFPTYIFCRIDRDSPSWPSLRWAPGLASFLGGPKGPTFIGDNVVSEIRARVDAWNQGGYKGRINSNAGVTVTKGPFQGLEGLFRRYLPARERCIVLLKLLGRYVYVEVETEAVRESGHVFRI
ncbi:MAG: transcription termination/antitermination protein NusG [Dehalococcoidia bacterium]